MFVLLACHLYCGPVISAWSGGLCSRSLWVVSTGSMSANKLSPVYLAHAGGTPPDLMQGPDPPPPILPLSPLLLSTARVVIHCSHPNYDSLLPRHMATSCTQVRQEIAMTRSCLALGCLVSSLQRSQQSVRAFVHGCWQLTPHLSMSLTQ